MALVAIKLGKLTKFSRVVSSSWPMMRGPVMEIRVMRGKAIVPSLRAETT
jgi:hypothetical protein